MSAKRKQGTDGDDAFAVVAATKSACSDRPHTTTPISLLLAGNKITNEERKMLTKFLSGNRTRPSKLCVILNQDIREHPTGDAYLEQIVFEANYKTGAWKKIRRKLRLAEGVVKSPAVVTQHSHLPATARGPS